MILMLQLLILFSDIWKNSVWNSVHYFCNTSVLNTGLLHVFIGILWIKEEGDQLEKEMAPLIIALTPIVQNMMKLQAFAQMGMSKYYFKLTFNQLRGSS